MAKSTFLNSIHSPLFGLDIAAHLLTSVRPVSVEVGGEGRPIHSFTSTSEIICCAVAVEGQVRPPRSQGGGGQLALLNDEEECERTFSSRVIRVQMVKVNSVWVVWNGHCCSGFSYFIHVCVGRKKPKEGENVVDLISFAC